MSYNHSKIITSAAGLTQSGSAQWNGSTSVINPYEQFRNKSLAPDDVPNSFSLALTYQLPMGKGKKFFNGGGVSNWLLGGWEITGLAKISSGTPFWFRSSNCGVPGQFRAACIPTVLNGADPFAVPVGSYDPGTHASAVQPGVFRAGEQFHRLSITGAWDRASAIFAARATGTWTSDSASAP